LGRAPIDIAFDDDEDVGEDDDDFDYGEF
jgi:hypothetical protein